MEFPIEDPRTSARQVVRDSVDAGLWNRNDAFTRKLVDTIKAHRLYSHPILKAWERNEFTAESMRMVHSEVRVAFAIVFTDALLRLAQTTTQIEPMVGPRAKMAARFLILLNVMDELGFKPNPAEAESFAGHPGHSHYWQLTETLEALGAPEETWASYVAAPESRVTRESIERNFGDHLRLATVLAVIETVFVPYYDPWARNTIAVCSSDIADGYHSIHVGDAEGNSVDDDHSEDSWYIVRQALTPERYAEVETVTAEVLDVWNRFIDMLLRRHEELKRAA